MRIEKGAAGILVLSLICAAGCMSMRSDPERRASAGRYALKRVVRLYALPAADMTNDVDRSAYLQSAAAGYDDVYTSYRDVPSVAAQAMRGMGDVYLAMDQFPAAMACYERVVREFPGESWEVIQCLKAMGDQLWARGLREEARVHFRGMVDRFGNTQNPPMFETLLAIARSRLNPEDEPSHR